MKELDQKIKKLVSNEIYIPNSYKNMIRNTLYEKDVSKSNKRNIFIRITSALCIGIIAITGIVFARPYVINNFFNHSKGIDTAVEHGYILNNDTQYIESNGVNIKIDSLLMDDYNLNISFLLEFENNIQNLNEIDFLDMIVTDDADRVLYCQDQLTFENFCKEKNLNYKWEDMNDNHINSGVNHYIKSINENKINVIYNLYANNFPNSKKLNIAITKIKISSIEEKIVSGNWNINIDIPEKFYNRESYIYQVENCTMEDLEIQEVIVSDTGTRIQIRTEETPELLYELNDDQETKEIKSAEWYEKVKNMTVEEYKANMENRKFKNEYIENEKGEKFYPSNSTSEDTGYSYSDMKFLNYWQTFDMTKYDATNRLKIYINYKGEDVYIILHKYGP